MSESWVFYNTTPSALTQRNEIHDTLSNWLKALLHMARTLFIHSSRITSSTPKNKPCTLRKLRRTLNAIGFGGLKRSQERPVASAMACHFSSKRCTKCNGPSAAKPRSGPGLEPCLHYLRICTKNSREARRREGDKCFFVQIFFG
ncbi:hypothetical protein ACI77I_21710 [Pseudomonas sp. D47]|uniref:hypothetical protein n=1 Tax=Pseudomonas sp. D47 TaxID=3159447 RepID=UPI00387B71E9